MDRLADNTNVPAAWFLVGATAVGKTAVAQHLAERTGAAILSADAMLVYRGMDIGTAKPAAAERGQVRYFGLDMADPDEPFSAGVWLHRVRAEWMASRDLPCLPAGSPAGSGLLVAGGTGLYVRALTQGLDVPAADPARRSYWQERLAREGLPALWHELIARVPQAGNLLADPENPRRVIRALEHFDSHGALPAGWRTVPRPRLVGLHLPRVSLHARILARVERMFGDGLIEEVQSLRARFPAWGRQSHTSGSVRTVAQPAAPGKSGVGADDIVSGDGRPAQAGSCEGLACTACQAIGYAEVCDLLDNRISREQAIAQIAARTRQLAKRQETWFRHQAEVTWIEITPEEPVADMAARVLAAWSEHGPTPIRLS
ncbi:MAG: tRNA (adenosine(37)-N6)-dimethylallyltransferase MiaA [bacterium]